MPMPMPVRAVDRHRHAEPASQVMVPVDQIVGTADPPGLLDVKDTWQRLPSSACPALLPS